MRGLPRERIFQTRFTVVTAVVIAIHGFDDAVLLFQTSLKQLRCCPHPPPPTRNLTINKPLSSLTTMSLILDTANK